MSARLSAPIFRRKKDEAPAARNPHECCTRSQIKSAIPLEPSDKLVLLVLVFSIGLLVYSIFQTLYLPKVIYYILSCASLSHNLYFHNKVNQIARVYEKKVVDWMSGVEENWVWFHFNSNNTEEVTYGCLKELPETVLKSTIRVTLRLCLSLKYVSLEFNTVSNTTILAKCWSLTNEGAKVANGELNTPMLPDPIMVATRLLT